MKGRSLKSFQDLQTEFHMPQTQFYRYLQLRHALSPSLEGLESLPEFSPIEAKVFMGDLQDHKISKIYQSLITHCSSTLQKLRRDWEGDVGQLEEEDWMEALIAPREAAIVVRLRLLQFKYFHRVYYTRMHLWRAGLLASPMCLRCSQEEGTFLHTVWHCPSLDRFWRGGFHLLIRGPRLGSCPYTYPGPDACHGRSGGNIYNATLSGWALHWPKGT